MMRINEVSKIKQGDQYHIFKCAKFIKREVTMVITNSRKRNNTKKIVYGKCHDRVDLTKRTRYEHSLMKLMRLTEDDSSLVNVMVVCK